MTSILQPIVILQAVKVRHKLPTLNPGIVRHVLCIFALFISEHGLSEEKEEKEKRA
jgi:hypothetical protein